jgi:aryl-alcohol dehydrogenase-like predicted oxidoreductase
LRCWHAKDSKANQFLGAIGTGGNSEFSYIAGSKYRLLGYNSKVTEGKATPEGTARFASRFAAMNAAQFYRTFDGVRVSSIGLGTYLGTPDDATDRAYQDAGMAAVRSGANVIDTAINYRNQRSERSIGAALDDLFRASDCRRDEIVVSTKAGFLTPGAVPAFLKTEHVVGGKHSMDPDFLADQIDRSRANLGLASIDVFYLHNPETQLAQVPREEFDSRIRAAFARLERIAGEGKIQYYGTATWDGYRRPKGARDALSLPRLLEIAQQEGGAQHRFRFIQLPVNLAMTEALANGTLEEARAANIAVMASASLLQARLASDLPEALAEKLRLNTDAQRAIQFTRSTPGVTIALVGMSKPVHVAENLQVGAIAPLPEHEYRELYQRA